MAKDLAKWAKEKGVKYFMISYTDLFGGQRAKLVPAQAIAQVCELTWQLRGEATGRQVEGATVGITVPTVVINTAVRRAANQRPARGHDG